MRPVVCRTVRYNDQPALWDSIDVAEKRMVGGLSFVVNGTMCCGVNGSALMVRVCPDGREEALAEPHVRPLEMGGRLVRGFVLIDPEGFSTDAALTAWVQRGLDFIGTLPAKRSRQEVRGELPNRSSG